MNNNLTVFSEDVIPVYTTETGEKVVLGRELHQKLGVGCGYSTWFKRMCAYEFVKKNGYISFSAPRLDGRDGRPRKEHLLNLETAQEIARIQRTQIGSSIVEKLNELQGIEEPQSLENNLTVFSEDVIPVYTTDSGEKVVLGRELHERLGIGQDYSSWFKRMCEYGRGEGFEEGESYSSVLTKSSENRGIGGRSKQDHILSLRMAKHIAAIQKTNIGYDIREKLFEIQEMMAEKRELPSYQIDDEIERAEAWLREARKRKALELECKAKDEKIAVLEPKANYYDLILQSSEALTVSQIAEDYGISPQAFNKMLEQFEIQHKVNGQWILYQPYKGKGYTVPRTYNYAHLNGSQGSNTLTCWTQKGRVFLYNFLKEKGIVPTIEKEAHAE